MEKETKTPEQEETLKETWKDKVDIRERNVSGMRVIYGRYKGKSTVCIVVNNDKDAAMKEVRKRLTKMALLDVTVTSKKLPEFLLFASPPQSGLAPAFCKLTAMGDPGLGKVSKDL